MSAPSLFLIVIPAKAGMTMRCCGGYPAGVARTVADFLLPEWEMLLDAFHWTRANASTLFNAKKTPVNLFPPASV